METASPLPRPEPDPGGRPGFTPDPAAGRVYATSRRVRGTDVTPDGRLRLDALARYLQDAAEDDVTDSGWREPCGWLLRRCVITIRGFPSVGEQVAVRTFCSAIGPRWAGSSAGSTARARRAAPCRRGCRCPGRLTACRRGRRGRSGLPTSTPPGTSTTRCTGPRPRRRWQARDGCRPAPSSTTAGRYVRAPGRAWRSCRSLPG